MGANQSQLDLAMTQNKILTKIYQNITWQNGFDTNVDLSEFSINELKDFWVYSLGLLGVQNFERFFSIEQEETNGEILQGHFKIKDMTQEEYRNYLLNNGLYIGKGGLPSVCDMGKIQDGNYKISRVKDDKGKSVRRMTLDTNPIRISPMPTYKYFPNTSIIKHVRNYIAHQIPYIKGSNLNYANGDEILTISKMWMRGYSEMFARDCISFDSNALIDELSQSLEKNSNEITNIDDVDRAIDCLKDSLPDKLKEKFNSVKDFVKKHIKFYPSFYSKPLDFKVKSIVYLFGKDPISYGEERPTINPVVIYNIQQIVSNEIVKRQQKAVEEGESIVYLEELGVGDIDLLKDLYDIRKRKSQASNKLIELYNKFESGKASNVDTTLLYGYIRNIDKLRNLVAEQIGKIEDRLKLESSQMDLFSYKELEYLPIDVAVNTICLMGYNALVTSGFYQDILENEKFKEMSYAKRRFFYPFNLNDFVYECEKKKDYNTFLNEYGYYTSTTQAHMLYTIRQALIHGDICYQIPKQNKNTDYDSKDVIITFENKFNKDLVKGSARDFFKLFSNEHFYENRPASVMSNPVDIVYSTENEEERDPEAEEIDNMISMLNDQKIQVDQEDRMLNCIYDEIFRN